MRSCKSIIFAVLILCAFSYVQAQQPEPISELFVPEDESSKLLREFFLEKRETPLEDKPELIISGDIRFEYDRYHEVVDGSSQRGRGALFPNDDYFVEANVLMDYYADCAWGSIKIEFKNRAGKVSGTNNGLDLERAYIGYNLYENGKTRWYVEVGRQQLFMKFESEVQYGSRLDGIFTRFSRELWDLGRWTIQGAFMVIDTRFDQYASIYETGLVDIKGSGFYTKLSYVNWMHNGLVRNFRRIPRPNEPLVVPGRQLWSYRIVQLLVGHRFKDFWRNKNLKIFMAYINNLIAYRRPLTDFTKANVAGYIGFQLGDIIKKGDWALKVVYDYVEAQSILESDNLGIGRGNINGDVLFLSPSLANARGVTNYKGVSAEAVYAITDEFTARLMYQRATSINKAIGGDLLFSRFMVRFVYAF